MKNIKSLSITFLIAVALFASAAFINKAPIIQAVVNNAKGFAVVELFTSEGCSSCPSADALMARVQKENAGKPIYILAYHVDYWNRLGWKDIFSKAEFSHRQSMYSVWLKLKGVYTPQAIVNGKTEFVGSAQGTLSNAIKAGLNKEADTQLSLTKININKHNATLTYNAANAADNTTLQLALVQKSAVSNVKSGENGGRTLTHVQIVNELKSISLQKSKLGETNIELPDNFSTKGFELVAFVQNNATGEITGATRAAFPDGAIASN